MGVQLAFIGSGGVANWQHFDNLERMDDAEIVAICDIDEEAARTAADRFDADVYTDHRDLYEEASNEIDAVFVCLPPFAHEDQELMAAERGIDLFVEKPLALSNEKAGEIWDAIEENDVVAQVGYNWRYSPGVDRARELLEGRTIGYIDGRWWGGVAGGEDHWWRHADRSGGQTVEQATHTFDTIRYLAGDVDRVFAAGENRISELVDFSDVTSATMKHESGAVSHVSTSCVAEDHQGGLDIVADGATLEVHQNAIEGIVDGEEIDEEFDREVEDNPYVREVQAFLEAVETGDDAGVRAPYADSTKSLALTLAVNESIESGNPVDLS
ncbi:Gfo/Idh/MocA family protein [Halomontanus rarus]|uniref:Gfo/Idh/MocA family protein n=1 Tax=Halomontanus rarus TaxID=3034020 RepID=UPI0023E7F7F8|nr:Gfo/Idh/MocA family oxidoreductase [Halovivax sp. TS33]